MKPEERLAWAEDAGCRDALKNDTAAMAQRRKDSVGYPDLLWAYELGLRLGEHLKKVKAKK